MFLGYLNAQIISNVLLDTIDLGPAFQYAFVFRRIHTASLYSIQHTWYNYHMHKSKQATACLRVL